MMTTPLASAAAAPAAPAAAAAGQLQCVPQPLQPQHEAMAVANAAAAADAAVRARMEAEERAMHARARVMQYGVQAQVSAASVSSAMSTASAAGTAGEADTIGRTNGVATRTTTPSVAATATAAGTGAAGTGAVPGAEDSGEMQMRLSWELQRWMDVVDSLLQAVVDQQQAGRWDKVAAYQSALQAHLIKIMHHIDASAGAPEPTDKNLYQQALAPEFVSAISAASLAAAAPPRRTTSPPRTGAEVEAVGGIGDAAEGGPEHPVEEAGIPGGLADTVTLRCGLMARTLSDADDSNLIHPQRPQHGMAPLSMQTGPRRPGSGGRAKSRRGTTGRTSRPFTAEERQRVAVAVGLFGEKAYHAISEHVGNRDALSIKNYLARQRRKKQQQQQQQQQNAAEEEEQGNKQQATSQTTVSDSDTALNAASSTTAASMHDTSNIHTEAPANASEVVDAAGKGSG